MMAQMTAYEIRMYVGDDEIDSDTLETIREAACDIARLLPMTGDEEIDLDTVLSRTAAFDAAVEMILS
jgi:hypothetical protein